MVHRPMTLDEMLAAQDAPTVPAPPGLTEEERIWLTPDGEARKALCAARNENLEAIKALLEETK